VVFEFLGLVGLLRSPFEEDCHPCNSVEIPNVPLHSVSVHRDDWGRGWLLSSLGRRGGAVLAWGG
jgi:hypothetical protein